MPREPDEGAEGLATGVAFPMVADLAVLDEFRRHRCDHPVAAARAAHGFGEGASGRNIRRVKLHNLGFLYFQGRLTLAANAEVENLDNWRAGWLMGPRIDGVVCAHKPAPPE